jgi:hypothetical protein
LTGSLEADITALLEADASAELVAAAELTAQVMVLFSALIAAC